MIFDLLLMNRRLIYSILISLLFLSFILFLIIKFQQSNELKVVFIDVGQGDSILVSQGSKQILIDGGKDGKLLLEKLGKHIPFWDRKIEMVVESHPDADHIGGLIEVFGSYEVLSVIKTSAKSDSKTFEVLQEEISKEKSEIIEAVRGQKIILSDSALGEIIYPFGKIDEEIKDTNSASVVFKLSYGENDFLFTGDIPDEKEKEILEKGINVESEVLKVSHHGSKYSSTSDFLKAVSPEDAIISAGKNNSYGHPHSDVLKRLIENKLNIFRTDEMGDIVYECKSVNEKCQRGW